MSPCESMERRGTERKRRDFETALIEHKMDSDTETLEGPLPVR